LIVTNTQIAEELMVLRDESEGNKQRKAQQNVSLFFGVKSIGALFSAILSGYLIVWLGIRECTPC
jgi:hypothetical protein